MARWVNVLKKTFDHMSEMVGYAMRATPAESLKKSQLDDEEHKSRIDVVISGWTQKRRGMISSVYREAGMRFIDIEGEKGRRCQISIDPIDLRVKEFGVHVADLQSRRKDYSTDIDNLSHKLDEAYATALRWLNE
jgi:hypothetical protein